MAPYRSIILLVAIWVSIFCHDTALADRPYRLLVVLSDESSAYTSTLESLRDTLYRSAGHAIPYELKIVAQVSADDGSMRISASDAFDLIVPVGTQATKAVHEWSLDIPVFNIMITKDVFSTVWGEGKGSPETSALFLEQPFIRQFQLIRLALPGFSRCGILLGERSWHLYPALASASRASGIELEGVVLSQFRNPVEGFKQVIDKNDVVLAFPDAGVLTPNHAKWLLYMAYERNVPVVGFSRAIVDAGALAAVFSTPEQIGRQAAEEIIEMMIENRRSPRRAWLLPGPQYPRYFNVEINQAVARSYGLQLRDGQLIAELLNALERLEQWQAQY